MSDVMQTTRQATEDQQQARAARRAALDEMTALASEEGSDFEVDNVDRIIQTR